MMTKRKMKPKPVCQFRPAQLPDQHSFKEDNKLHEKEVLTESKQGPDEESEAFAEPKEDMHEELFGSNVISMRKSHQDIIENFKKYTSSLRIF